MPVTKNLELYYLNRPVADLAALKAINTTSIVTSEVVKMADASIGGMFSFNKTSVATPDDRDIIAPTVGGGRWERLTQHTMLTTAAGKMDINNIAATSSVIVDDFLKYDGSNWVNSQIPVSAGNGVDLFLDATASDISGYQTLSDRSSASSETSSSATVNVGTGEVLIKAFATGVGYPALTLLDNGAWNPLIYAKVDNAAGNTQIVCRIYKRDLASAETELFNIVSDDINTTSTSLFQKISVELSFVVLATDRIVVKYFAKTDNASSILVTMYYQGSSHASYMHTPWRINHNQLPGLQGGSSGQQYHLTSAEHVVATQSSTSSRDGFLTSTDWSTFNSKEPAVTKGNLTTTTTGIAIGSGTGAVIGSGTTVNADAGYGIPTTAQLSAITHTNRTNLDTINQNMASTDSVTFGGVTLPGSGSLLNIGTATELATPAITLTSRNSGYAAPSNNTLTSIGDKWVFWNATVYKGSIGFNGSEMWFQSTGSASANRFRWFLGTGGVPTEALQLVQSAGFIWNDTGNASYDFRCEGDTDANLFFLDAGTDQACFGTNSPISGTKLTVSGSLGVSTLNVANGIVKSDANGVLTSSVALPNGTTATTQAASDNSTKVATTAYVDSAVGGENSWDRVTGTPNYVLPHTANDDIGATGARINKVWSSAVDSSAITIPGFTNTDGIIKTDVSGNFVQSVTKLTAPSTNQFQLSSGTTDLLVTADCTINQNLSSTSRPAFDGVVTSQNSGFWIPLAATHDYGASNMEPTYVKYSNGTAGNIFRLKTANGSLASPLPLNDGQTTTQFSFQSYRESTASFVNDGNIHHNIVTAGVAGDNEAGHVSRLGLRANGASYASGTNFYIYPDKINFLNTAEFTTVKTNTSQALNNAVYNFKGYDGTISFAIGTDNKITFSKDVTLDTSRLFYNNSTTGAIYQTITNSFQTGVATSEHVKYTDGSASYFFADNYYHRCGTPGSITDSTDGSVANKYNVYFRKSSADRIGMSIVDSLTSISSFTPKRSYYIDTTETLRLEKGKVTLPMAGGTYIDSGTFNVYVTLSPISTQIYMNNSTMTFTNYSSAAQLIYCEHAYQAGDLTELFYKYTNGTLQTNYNRTISHRVGTPGSITDSTDGSIAFRGIYTFRKTTDRVAVQEIISLTNAASFTPRVVWEIDTLNTLQLDKGVVTIPTLTITTALNFSGTLKTDVLQANTSTPLLIKGYDGTTGLSIAASGGQITTDRQFNIDSNQGGSIYWIGKTSHSVWLNAQQQDRTVDSEIQIDSWTSGGASGPRYRKSVYSNSGTYPTRGDSADGSIAEHELWYFYKTSSGGNKLAAERVVSLQSLSSFTPRVSYYIDAAETLRIDKNVVTILNTLKTDVVQTNTNTSMTIKGYDSATAISISASNGVVSYSSMPRFQAYLSSDVLNITGKDATYSLICDTEIEDRTSSYDTSTGIFTVPTGRGGKYIFYSHLFLEGIGTTNVNWSIYINVNGGSATYQLFGDGFASSSCPITAFDRTLVSPIITLSAGDTVNLEIIITGAGSNDIDIRGTSVYFGASNFGGYMIA